MAVETHRGHGARIVKGIKFCCESECGLSLPATRGAKSNTLFRECLSPDAKKSVPPGRKKKGAAVLDCPAR